MTQDVLPERSPRRRHGGVPPLAFAGFAAGAAAMAGLTALWPTVGAAGASLLAGITAFRMVGRRVAARERRADLDQGLADIGPKMAGSTLPRAVARDDGTIVLSNQAWEEAELPLLAIPGDWLDDIAEGAGHVVFHADNGHDFEVSHRRLPELPGHRHWLARDMTAAARIELDMFEHADLGWIETTTAGAVTFVNATLANWIGRPAAELSAGDITLDHLLRATEEGGGGERFRANLVTRSGEDFPVEVVIESEYQRDGRRAALVIDLREIVRSVEALAASAERFGRFIDDAPVGIAACTGNGRIIEANPAFAEFLTGKTDVLPLLDREIADFLRPGDDLDAVVASLDPVLAGAETASADLSFAVSPETTYRVFAARGHEVGQAGEQRTEIVYLIDISAQKTLEAQFVQSQKMQAVGQLAGGIAHDFNNLLTAVMGFCDLLLVRHGPQDESFADIMQIKQNANRAANLTRQLLAFSRRQTLLLRVIDIRGALNDLSTLLRRLIGANIRLELEHDPDLWLVRVDTSQFDQVIINLVVNARDAMPSGGRILIRTRNIPRYRATLLGSMGVSRGDYVMIEVADTGAGISKDVLPKIFEPFFTTKEVGAGTGLGLSTVYGIVKQTGGAISAESEPGQGALFRILLPRHMASQKDQVEAPPPEAPERPEQPQETGTILIVEDEEPVRNFAVRALRRQGYRVMEATSGEEAIELIEQEGDGIDLLISDVVMPSIDGPSLASRVRKRIPDLKVILISGYAEDAFSRSLDPTLVFTFLPKPFSLKQLAETVRETLRGKA